MSDDQDQQTEHLHIRMPEKLLLAIDEKRAELTKSAPYIKWTRSSVIRFIIAKALTPGDVDGLT